MGAFESVDGLVQALPEEARDDARAFLGNYIDKGTHNATAVALRKAQSELTELRALKATHEADAANLREQAEAAKGLGGKLTEYEQQLKALQAERDRLAGYRDKYARRAFVDLVAEKGGISDRDYVPGIVERLGLAPRIADDGGVTLDEDGAKRLAEFLEKPEHRAKYQGKPAAYQRPGRPAEPGAPSPTDAIRKRIEATTDPGKREALIRAARGQGIRL